MDARIDELERLAALHRSGVLTDDEFAAAKTKALHGQPAATSGGAATPAASAPHDPPRLSATWQRRFAFFDEHGSPLTSHGAVALQKLPFWSGMSIRSNIWGFVFGPFYFLFLGLWRRGAALFVLAVVLSYVVAWLVRRRGGPDGRRPVLGLLLDDGQLRPLHQGHPGPRRVEPLCRRLHRPCNVER